MNALKRLGLTLALAVAAAGAVAGAAAAEPALTIYNQDFAVVRETVPLDLEAGANRIAFTDITAHLEPDSVMLRDPAGKRAIQILEQDYRGDPVSQGRLLDLYEGERIGFLVQRGEEQEVVMGRIVRSGYVPPNPAMNRSGYNYAQQQAAQAAAGQPIIEVNNLLRFDLPGVPLFPALKDDTVLKPTLNWVLEADRAGALDAELCYVTGGMTWEASYNLVAPEKGDTLDVVGWVTMENRTGRTFPDARIKLMAGDVSKIQEDRRYMVGGFLAVPSSGAGLMPPVAEKTFDEYHLYTLARPTTLHDGETKQVEFIRAAKVAFNRFYVYDGFKTDQNRYHGWDSAMIRNEHNYGTGSNPDVWTMCEFANTKANHLGMPLPKGRTRFYRRDDDRQLEFTGENTIDHTPRDETVRVYVGNAFDLAGERRRTDYLIDTGRRTADEAFEIRLRNRKDGPVQIRVVEHLYRWHTWEILASSDPFEKLDSQLIEFRVEVPPGEERIVTYNVHYTW
ncbi:MAG: hypothetical protein JXR94_15940 [Candidatus Hydrogenedentes bacterium]|nr:hypothetical protein [Candidatus Hydrogenedentota bacterium]